MANKHRLQELLLAVQNHDWLDLGTIANESVALVQLVSWRHYVNDDALLARDELYGWFKVELVWWRLAQPQGATISADALSDGARLGQAKSSAEHVAHPYATFGL